jgi:hypothetical protein
MVHFTSGVNRESSNNLGDSCLVRTPRQIFRRVPLMVTILSLSQAGDLQQFESPAFNFQTESGIDSR